MARLRDIFFVEGGLRRRRIYVYVYTAHCGRQLAVCRKKLHNQYLYRRHARMYNVCVCLCARARENCARSGNLVNYLCQP